MIWKYPEPVAEFIRENVVGHTSAELADMVNRQFGTDFTPAKIKAFKSNHHLKSGTPAGTPAGLPTELYPLEVKDYILAHYKGTRYAEMADQLRQAFGREYTVKQMEAYYKNHKLNSGLTGRFEPGNVPHNKGQHFAAPGSEKGWFQPGDDPYNTVPVGTVLMKSDGYLWKKLEAEPKAGRNNWKQLHRIIWEEANGPIPDDCILVFRDQNRENCTLENLALVGRAVLGTMNLHGVKVTTQEGTDAKILIAKIRIAVKAKKRRKK